MTLSEHLSNTQAALKAVRAAYPGTFVEEQSDGCPDANAVIVVYRRKADRRRKDGFRLVPLGACRMTAAAAGATTLYPALRGWNGQ